jgi:hypothetical protein
MKTFLPVTAAVPLVLFMCSVLQGQTVTLTFQGGAVTAGPKYTFEVFAQASAPVKMGTANLVFSYSTAGFGTTAAAVLTPSNYSGGNYQPMGFTDFGVGKKSINIELNSDNNGTAIETLYPGTLVGVIEMTIVNGNASAGLVWDAGASPIHADDNATLLATAAGNSDDTGPLPIQLVNIVAEVNDRVVRLQWRTASEINNYGFEVEREYLGLKTKVAGRGFVNEGLETAWSKAGFVEGHGTTVEAKTYEFADQPSKLGSYGYRLKQIDLDGKFSYSAKVDVEVGVPKVFTLYQNYPNPFNPMTTISYGLPTGVRVTLRIYNVLGQVVKTLVDEDEVPGAYGAQFDASSVASGVYFYRLRAGSFIQTKKMLVLK